MFNLTRQEKTVLLFLSLLILFGLGINLSLKKSVNLRNLYQHSINLSSKLDINKATYQELVSLPNIGPALANQIIGYRLSHNEFKDIAELKNIKGISRKKFNQIKDFFYLDKKN